ncbi:MAG: TetR/AcrR family transcriptional regulator [Bacilli bacterium]|nr:TetR/AcrR family transcriptional regulator [Bacilli bacterium]
MRHKNQSNEFIKECFCTAYMKLLQKKPKGDITITEICDAAGFGRTTYYRHFTNNKDEMIIYIGVKRWLEYKEAHLDEVKENEGYQFFVHLHNHKQYMMILGRQDLISVLFKILYKIFGLKSDEDESLRYTRDLLVGMYFGVTYDWILHGCVDTPEEIKEKIEKGIALAAQEHTRNIN